MSKKRIRVIGLFIAVLSLAVLSGCGSAKKKQKAKKGNLSKILQRVFLSLLYIGENHENHGEIKRCVLGKKRL